MRLGPSLWARLQCASLRISLARSCPVSFVSEFDPKVPMFRPFRSSAGASRRRNAATLAASAVVLAPALAALTPSAALAVNYTSATIGQFQNYLYGPAPQGVGLFSAQNAIPGSKGENVKTYVFEGVPDFRHEDLAPTLASGHLKFKAGDLDKTDTSGHALSTASILSADATPGTGIRGILAEGDVTIYASEIDGNGISRGLPKVTAEDLGPGDVVLLEAQGWGYLPVEENAATYAAIKAATDKGIIVVEPSGNGGVNLDSSGFPERADSGAIMVGGGQQDPHDDCGAGTDVARAWGGSNYGSRVDVQGPYSCQAAAANTDGYEFGSDLAGYGTGFGGTSGASALVAGLAASVSSAYEQEKGEPLTPEGARNALVQTGSAQALGNGESSITKKVGPLPNVPAAVDFLKKAPNTTITHQLTTSPGTPTRPYFQFTRTSTAPYTVGKPSECRFVRAGEPKPTWDSCGSSGVWMPPADLRPGLYTFEVRGVTGGSTPATSTQKNFDPTPAVSTPFAVTAGASTASISGSTLTVSAASTTLPENDEITVSAAGANFFVRNENVVVAGSGCTTVDEFLVSCPRAGITKLVVNSYKGDDTITASVAIATELNGGDGDDVISGLGGAQDSIDGGDGVDTVSYADATAARRVSLANSNTPDDGPLDGAGTPDLVKDTESVIGTDFNDQISAAGTTANTPNPRNSSMMPVGRIDSGDGADTITSGGNITYIDAGAGNDVVTGITTDTAAYGGSGDDSLAASTGLSTELIGGPGNDALSAGATQAVLRGGTGVDTLNGNNGSVGVTSFYPGAGDDVVNAGDPAGYAALMYNLRPDNVIVALNGSSPAVTGTLADAGTDTLTGVFDQVSTGFGNDLIVPLPSTKIVNGSHGTDRVSFVNWTFGITTTALPKFNDTGARQTNHLRVQPFTTGTADVDLGEIEKIDGTLQADQLSAGDNSTYDMYTRRPYSGLQLDGRGGDDDLIGGSLADTLIGGTGIDTVSGRGGVDTLRLDDGVAGDKATCGTTSPYDVLNKDSGDILLSGICP